MNSFLISHSETSEPLSANSDELPKATSDCIQSYHNPRGGGQDGTPGGSPPHPQTQEDGGELSVLIVPGEETPPSNHGLKNGDVAIEMKPVLDVSMATSTL